MLKQIILMVEGCFLAALGIWILKSGGLLAGGTTGLAILITSVTPSMSFGLWFSLINAPFYLLGLVFLGGKFLLRTFFCVLLVSVTVDVLDWQLYLQPPPPWMTIVLSGCLIAFGMTLLLRNGASLGGINIMALYLHHRTGIATAQAILAADIMIMVLSLVSYPIIAVAYSAMTVILIGLLLGYHLTPNLLSRKTVSNA
ncbi:MAG: YitT family protein [Oceanospirillaceae bacterium]|jgi:uncharacterized membrane-anchored protein YitT (DUF2179 family)|nr:YitT family protein [Oceanospirillaceae bacterium]MBT4444018.1 YitT family protein [Oceanospirillaceae bacterium]